MKTIFDTGTLFTQGVPVYAARVLGLERATVYMTIKALCGSAAAKHANGHNWMVKTVEQWHEEFFGFTSDRTLKKILADLEDCGLLVACQPEGSVSRRRWLRIGEGAESKFTMESYGFDKEIDSKAKENTRELVNEYIQKGLEVSEELVSSTVKLLPRQDGETSSPSSKEREERYNTLREPSIGSPCGEQEGFSLDQEASPTTPTQLIPSKQEASTPTQSEAERSASEQKKEKVAKKERKPRERNPIIDAIAAIDGPIDQVLPSKWSLYAKIAKEILSVCPGITTEEITRRVSRYRAIFPTAAVTSTAIASHWAKLSVATKEERREANIRYI